MNPMKLTQLGATLGAIPADLALALGRCVAPALAAARLATGPRQVG